MAQRSITPGQATWLRAELARWVGAGLVSAQSAEVITAEYAVRRRASLVGLVVGLGGAFLGIGIIWLVAANLEHLGLLSRFVLILALWLGLVVAGEVLAQRGASGHGSARLLAGVLRFVAVAAFGAVIFQAANSLQVPAASPRLVGLWAVGALAYSYAVGSPLGEWLGAALAGFWWVWQVMDAGEGQPTFALAATSGGLMAVAIALAVQPGRGRWGAMPWIHTGAALSLLGVLVAAFPASGPAPAWPPLVIAALIIAILAAAAAALRGGLRGARALVPAALSMVLAAGLVMWTSPRTAAGLDSEPSLGRAAVAVVGYLLLATAWALVGADRDEPSITLLALLALVLFITIQAFSVFASILSGAALFLAVGAVLVASGVLAERGWRRFRESEEAERGAGASEPTDDQQLTAPLPSASEPTGWPRLGLVVAVLLVALVPLAVWTQISARLTGEVVTLRVVARDPLDPLRGAYVGLTYPDLPSPVLMSAEPPPAGSPQAGADTAPWVYVPLRRSGDTWVGGAAVEARPASGVYLRCDAREGQLDCGISEFFVGQERAEEIQAALMKGSLSAEVAVDRWGHAALLEVR